MEHKIHDLKLANTWVIWHDSPVQHESYAEVADVATWRNGLRVIGRMKCVADYIVYLGVLQGSGAEWIKKMYSTVFSDFETDLSTNLPKFRLFANDNAKYLSSHHIFVDGVMPTLEPYDDVYVLQYTVDEKCCNLWGIIITVLTTGKYKNIVGASVMGYRYFNKILLFIRHTEDVNDSADAENLSDLREVYQLIEDLSGIKSEGFRVLPAEAADVTTTAPATTAAGF